MSKCETCLLLVESPRKKHWLELKKSNNFFFLCESYWSQVMLGLSTDSEHTINWIWTKSVCWFSRYWQKHYEERTDGRTDRRTHARTQTKIIVPRFRSETKKVLASFYFVRFLKINFENSEWAFLFWCFVCLKKEKEKKIIFNILNTVFLFWWFVCFRWTKECWLCCCSVRCSYRRVRDGGSEFASAELLM
jgi:hypothetical protein